MKKTAVTAAVSSLLTAAFVLSVTNVFDGAVDAHSVYNCDVNGDGVINVMDLNVVKTALIREMTGANQAHPAVTETPAVTAPAATAIPAKVNEDDLSVAYPDPYVEPYSGLLDHYYDMFTMQDGDIPEGFGANWYGPRLSGNKEAAFENVGYAFKDLNDDSVPELIISDITDKDTNTGTELGVVYSYDVLHGKVVEVLESWYRNQTFLISSDTLANISSSGAAYTSTEKFKFEKTTFDHKVISYVFSEPVDDKVVFYSNTTGENDKSISDVVPNYDLNADHAELLAAKQQIEFVPLKSLRDNKPVNVSYFSEGLKDYAAYHLFSEPEKNTVFTTNDDITYLTVYNAVLTDEKWMIKPICTCKELKKGQSLAAGISYPGDIPNTGVSFIDKFGIKHFYLLGQSGKDGSLSLSDPVYPVERTMSGAPEVDLSDIAGVWYKGGDTSSAYVNISAAGKYTAYFADGNVEASGKIVKDKDSYVLYRADGTSFVTFALEDKTKSDDMYTYAGGDEKIHYIKLLGPDGAASDGRGIEEVLAGSWECEKTGLIIDYKGEGIFHALVEVRDTVGGYFRWNYSLIYDNGVLKCDKQGIKTLTVGFLSEDPLNPKTDTFYTDGSAEFVLDGENLIWKDYKEDAGKGMKFVKLYDADVLNNK